MLSNGAGEGEKRKLGHVMEVEALSIDISMNSFWIERMKSSLSIGLLFLNEKKTSARDLSSLKRFLSRWLLSRLLRYAAKVLFRVLKENAKSSSKSFFQFPSQLSHAPRTFPLFLPPHPTTAAHFLRHPRYDVMRDKRIYTPITIIIDLTYECAVDIFFNHRWWKKIASRVAH